jgi:hypothetical protein
MCDIAHISSSPLGSASYSDGIRMGVHNHSVWRKFLDSVLEPRTLADENGIIEYLRCYRHDLPPAVWIENRPLRPD